MENEVWEIKKYIALIVIKVSFSQKGNKNSLKRKDTVNQSGARTVGVKERLKKEPVTFEDNCNVPGTYSI